MDPLAHDFASWSPYNYVLGNPILLTDPDGKSPQWPTPETVWDVINVGMGVASFGANVAAGNYGKAAIDAAGLVYDVGSAFVPIFPGGASAAIGIKRLYSLTNKVSNNIGNSLSILKDKSGIASEVAGQLSKAKNSISGKGQIDDILGAIKEKLGIPLEFGKTGGSPEGHIEKVERTMNSLNKASKQIDRLLGSSNKLTKTEIGTLTQTQKTLNDLNGKYKSILDAADKAAEALD